MYTKWLSILAHTIFFSDIEKNQLNDMLLCLRPTIKTYSSNEIIVSAKEDIKGIGVLVSGRVSVEKETASGTSLVMRVLDEGEIFGEIGAFSSDPRWPASVFALNDCTVLFIEQNKIVGPCSKLCNGHRQLVVNLLEIVSERALMLNKKVEYLSIKSMRGKLSTFILEQHRKQGAEIFDLNMNRNQLADFLNVSRPSMSRELSHMKDDGLIDFYLSTIRIKDLEALKDFAQS